MEEAKAAIGEPAGTEHSPELGDRRAARGVVGWRFTVSAMSSGTLFAGWTRTACPMRRKLSRAVAIDASRVGTWSAGTAARKSTATSMSEPEPVERSRAAAR